LAQQVQPRAEVELVERGLVAHRHLLLLIPLTRELAARFLRWRTFLKSPLDRDELVWRSQVVWNRGPPTGVVLRMTRTHRCLVGVATVLVLTGCGLGGSSTGHSKADERASGTTPSARAHIVATLDVTSANAAVATQTRLWLLGGPSGVITQVDPATN